jgi:hypothetical protein
VRRSLWLLLAFAILFLLASACTEEDANLLLTAVPTMVAPTPSAPIGPPVIIDARVREASSLLNMIAIQSVQGFKFVMIDAATTIVAPGERLITLADLHPNDIITVSGPPIATGHTILATHIAMRPALLTSVNDEAPEPGDKVIARFFQMIKAGNVTRAVQLVASASRAQQGQEAWVAQLRTVRKVQLLSVAQINQPLWTPNWQEYLVLARVTVDPGGQWQSGVNRWYVDLVRGSSGPWSILEIRGEPGLPVRMVRLEGQLVDVDLPQRILTVQPTDQAAAKIALAEHTLIVTEDGIVVPIGELQPGRAVEVEGLPTVGGAIVPDRITVGNPPGQPAVVIAPGEGATGQSVHLLGENWPANTPIRVYVTVPTATFQPEPVAEGTTGADGKFDLAVTIPERWPNDAPVVEKDLNIVVSTADFRARARAQFQVVAPG